VLTSITFARGRADYDLGVMDSDTRSVLFASATVALVALVSFVGFWMDDLSGYGQKLVFGGVLVLAYLIVKFFGPSERDH
jgi:hypothetical protein